MSFQMGLPRLNQFKKLFIKNNVNSNYHQDTLPKLNKGNEELEFNALSDKALAEMANSACAQFSFYIREDGEFAVTSEFRRTDAEVVDISSTVLHMINSGLMAEYFMKSLKLWGANMEEQKFVLEIIKRWKVLYEEDKKPSNNAHPEFNLAVDPTDVFGLKSLKGEQ